MILLESTPDHTIQGDDKQFLVDNMDEVLDKPKQITDQDLLDESQFPADYDDDSKFNTILSLSICCRNIAELTRR